MTNISEAANDGKVYMVRDIGDWADRCGDLLVKNGNLEEESADLRRQLAEAKAREDRVWKHCRVIFYPTDGLSYPFEHAPLAGKDMREAIEKEIAEMEGGE